MFDLPYARWLDAVYVAVIGAGAYAANNPKPELGLVGGLLAASGFVMIAGNEWGCMVNKSKELSPDQSLMSEAELVRTGKQRAAELQMPKVNTWTPKPTGDFVYNLKLAPVKIDLEREFCQTLVDMRTVDGKMDISETYWLKGGHWKGTPTEFKQMRNKFEACHIFGKKGTADNSPYVVLNEQAVEMRASGKLKKLPTPPGV